ncbi:hypothetical protein PF004_g9492 [Phytophthora fragariae]|uniref:DDE-1 domain-containing protein n=2 Tax=Phytophthora fragariae TaxID=53985 RepID=A0A6G0P408_9STRA|nr:hypothetical protein PF004_g9492 [Phytophthora fragariae]
MIRHPKNKNKVKLKALDRGTKTVIAASAAVGVHRSTWYRWKGQEAVIKSAAEDAPAKFYTHRSTEMYIGNPSLEKKFLDWIVEMRKNRYLCVSMECLLLMLGLYDPERVKTRSRNWNMSFIRRFLKRNRLSIRRITHKGRTKRPDMELVANAFSRSIQHAIEEDGILSSERGDAKPAAVFNMDQTAVYIGIAGNRTIDFVGNATVDVQQGSEINGFRASVFLTASATGLKLPPLIVFAGIPGGPVSQEVWSPAFGSPEAEHTVQKKAFCNKAVMMEWIELVWKSSVDGCRLLILDNLKVHKMSSPLDVTVVKPFKDAFRRIYLTYHLENRFPTTTSEKRSLISRFVVEAWAEVKPETLVKGFARAGVIPTGPRDRDGRFRVPAAVPDAPVVQDN